MKGKTSTCKQYKCPSVLASNHQPLAAKLRDSDNGYIRIHNIPNLLSLAWDALAYFTVSDALCVYCTLDFWEKSSWPARENTHTHSRTHARTHTHTHVGFYAFHRRNGFYTVQTVCAIALSHTRTHTHSLTHTHAHTLTHTHSLSHTLSLSYTHTNEWTMELSRQLNVLFYSFMKDL